MSFRAATCPIYVNCRDRVNDLRRLLVWLERAGHERIMLLDNNSAFEPLLEFYEQTPHEVIRLGSNLGSRAVWRAGLTPTREYWVYTDPDVVPLGECPCNAVELLYALLGEFSYPKAGLGLYLDDTPEFPSKEWERSLVSPTRYLAHIGTVALYDSLIDTSFALHRPGVGHTLTAIRTGYPYQARHMPWYRYDEPTDEERFYLERAIEGPLGSSWAQAV